MRSAFPTIYTLGKPKVFMTSEKDKFGTIYEAAQAALLTRTLFDEAEILSLFVHPSARKLGRAQSLFNQFFDDSAQNGVRQIHLEVSTDNQAAIGFYKKNGFVKNHVRKAYYHRRDGQKIDALTMLKLL